MMTRLVEATPPFSRLSSPKGRSSRVKARLRACSAHHNRLAAGFTLIEVLVAVVIFALMAAMAYRGLTAILDSKRQIDRENEKWRNLTVLFSRLERDLAVAAPRPVRDATRPYADALNGEAVVVGEHGALLTFTRMGSADDAGPLAAPQRVAYRLRDGNVEVLLWPVLDQAPRTVPEANVIAANIAGFTLRYLDFAGQWRTRWPGVADLAQGSASLPKAVEATVTLASGEVLIRLFLLPLSRQQMPGPPPTTPAPPSPTQATP